MANSTSNLDLLVQSQAGKEITANALFDAVSMAALYGRRQSTTSGLTWGYYGGNLTIDGALVQVGNGSVTLTASATNYLVALKSSGAVSVSTTNTNWNDTTNYWRLYSIVTGTATVTSYTDARQFARFTSDGLYDPAGTAASEVTAHEAESDPHPQYLTPAEGNTAYSPLAHAGNTANPHSVTKAQVGLGSADNTADADKPVSTATQSEFNQIKSLSWMGI